MIEHTVKPDKLSQKYQKLINQSRLNFEEVDECDDILGVSEFKRKRSGTYRLDREIVTALLKLNKGNRAIKPKAVERYAKDMLNGDWTLSGEAIIVDENDILVSGQHRLYAFLEASDQDKHLPKVLTDIRFGVPEKAREVVDQAVPRRTSDVLKMNRGTLYANPMAAACRLLTFHMMSSLTQGLNAGYSITQKENLKTYDEHPDLDIFFKVGKDEGWISSIMARSYIGWGYAAFIYYVLANIDRPKADTFFSSLCKGTNLDENDPVYQLRNWFEAKRNSGAARYPKPIERIAVVFKCWKLYTGEDKQLPKSAKGWTAKYRWTVADHQDFPRLDNDPFVGIGKKSRV